MFAISYSAMNLLFEICLSVDVLLILKELKHQENMF
jgi:hypothetical protein